MATPQIQNPALFLSHSGEQKGFTWSLYRELLHVNHNPFFDQDSRDHSLPKGSPFPSRIVEACRACKLGVVVLSHEYIESLWPMLELQQLLFHNPYAPHNVYPVFYKLKPVDLCKEENLKQWKHAWESHAASWDARRQVLPMAASDTLSSLTLDISSWPKALEMLRYQNGEILPDNKDEHAFIQTVVSNICERLPPPDSFLIGDHFKGAEHIQQTIHELFQQQQQQRDEEIDDPRRMPIFVGVYGVGGSGKTTMCKYMLRFYNKEYPGSCCFLQFPSREEEESQLLVQSMKDILSKRANLAKETLNIIKSVEQAMPHLQELLQRYKVFFILDNVWEWALHIAKQIVAMEYMPGSRLLVTARSKGLLELLSSNLRIHIHVDEAVGSMPAMQIVPVPSISENEAIEALMAYNFLTSWQYANNGEDLRGLAKSCFFHEKCHPLLLKAVGTKLRHLSGRIHSAEDWTQLISHLQDHEIYSDEKIEGAIVNVFKTSYDAVHSKLQKTFLKLVTCVPKRSTWPHDFRSLLGLSRWLSMLSDSGPHTIEDIRAQLIELEYHGLIQIHGEDEDVVIHDLQMMLIENVVQENNGSPRCFFFEGDVATLSLVSEWRRIRYICGFVGDFMRDFSPQRRFLNHRNGCFSFDQRANCLGIEVLYLAEVNESLHGSVWLSVKHMQFLRYLVLDGVKNLREVGGWHGAPNLVSVKLIHCWELRKIENMTCLRGLESLTITSSDNLKRLIIPGQLQELDLSYSSTLWSMNVGMLSACASLQRCILSGTRIRKFPDFNSINLRVLDLSWCERLQCMEGSVCGLTALEELSLRFCTNVESIPDLKQLVKLRRLDLGGCEALKEVKVGDAALTSLEHLSINYDVCDLSILSSSPLPISVFTNLRVLCARGHKWAGGGGELDVGSSKLPVSLESLDLSGFERAQEITGLGDLVNLQHLEVRFWPCLTALTGLGPLTMLAYLKIWSGASLREVGHWEAPFISNLQYVRIRDCPNLETLSTMRHLTSLTEFCIENCPNVQREMLPEGASGYINGKTEGMDW